MSDATGPWPCATCGDSLSAGVWREGVGPYCRWCVPKDASGRLLSGNYANYPPVTAPAKLARTWHEALAEFKDPGYLRGLADSLDTGDLYERVKAGRLRAIAERIAPIYAEAGWIIETERDAALVMLCDLREMYLRDGTRECCGHCPGCLGAMNLAAEWRAADKGETHA